jgi:hypothetical protein
MAEPDPCCETCRQAREISCPTCNAEPGQPCKTPLADGMRTEQRCTHLVRRTRRAIKDKDDRE